MSKLITWIDLQGCYMVTASKAEDDEALELVWNNICNHFGLPVDHPHFYLEPEVLQVKIDTLSGEGFRYGALQNGPNGNRDGRDGAWEMDIDGTPTINMPKARGGHMDSIRLMRNAELVKEDLNMLKALENGDTDTQNIVRAKKQELRDNPQTFDLTTENDTPLELKDKWPEGLPKE